MKSPDFFLSPSCENTDAFITGRGKGMALGTNLTQVSSKIFKGSLLIGSTSIQNKMFKTKMKVPNEQKSVSLPVPVHILSHWEPSELSTN